MIDERHEELASLHAFDLLEGAELAAFESALSTNPELPKLVEDLRNTAPAIGLTAPLVTPRPELRARILASLPARAASPATPAKAEATIIPFRLALWTGWAAAACFALVSAYFGSRYFAATSETLALRQDIELTRIEAQSSRQQIEAERILATRQIADLEKAGDIANLKIARLADLLGNSPQAVAVAVWNPLKQEGVLTVEKLPVLQNDQDYQLWVVDPAYTNPVNGGVFTVDAKGLARVQFRPDQSVSAVTTFAISRERKGGVPKAEGPIVAAGTF